MSTAILTCSCGTKNRITLGVVKTRCGKCKHVFTPAELTKATVEGMPRPTMSEHEPCDTELTCTDDTCGWAGEPNDCTFGYNGQARCPECGKKVMNEAGD